MFVLNYTLQTFVKKLLKLFNEFIHSFKNYLFFCRMYIYINEIWSNIKSNISKIRITSFRLICRVNIFYSFFYFIILHQSIIYEQNKNRFFINCIWTTQNYAATYFYELPFFYELINILSNLLISVISFYNVNS